MNFRRWNYNCPFFYYYLIMEKIYKINNVNVKRFKQARINGGSNYDSLMGYKRLLLQSMITKYFVIFEYGKNEMKKIEN
jgi:hypothetical protein